MISLNTPRLEDQWLDLKQAQEIRLDSLEHKFQVREELFRHAKLQKPTQFFSKHKYLLFRNKER